MAMSTRPVTALMFGVNVTIAPPWLMNVPPVTCRTRNTLGLNVSVNVMVDRRDTLLIEIGTVYGPPATRNSVPGVVISSCAAPAGPGAVGAGAGGAFGSRGGVAGGGGTPSVPGGGTVPGAPGGVPGGVVPGAA